ncbi:unnamed protein product [Brugia pahangi]|uniref:DUF676 domain-containing protein n=1 Tax=Brugia pahangi TaxID=6280 RepID=A0A0N4SWQ4_BRUPA|nr:unnamed protein product [Brugia pahangi]
MNTDVTSRKMPCIFIVTHGPRSIEFKLKISVSDFRRENPKLLVNCRSELRKQISGLCFAILNEMQETDFENTLSCVVLIHFWNHCTILLCQRDTEIQLIKSNYYLQRFRSIWYKYIFYNVFKMHALYEYQIFSSLNENPAVNYATLNYPMMLIGYASQN